MRVYTLNEAADLLNMHRNTLRKHLWSRSNPTGIVWVPLGKKKVIREQRINEYLEALEVAGFESVQPVDVGGNE